MKKILIFTIKETARIRYIFDFIWREFSGIQVEFTSDVEKFKEYAGPKINYSARAFADEIHLNIDELFFSNEISPLVEWHELNEVGKLFYALTRYEEYLPQQKDLHGRVSGKNRVYKTPFVDTWILECQQKLKEKYPDLTFKERTFNLALSCDVDQAWKYKNKGFKRTLLGFIRDCVNMDVREIARGNSVRAGEETDPFDTFDFFKKINEKYKVPVLFFWLMADYGRFDKNININNRAFQRKIKETTDWAGCGIHPSYASNKNKSKIVQEKMRLQTVVNFEIKKSRQHYIMLSLPKTYQNLIEAGISEDYTMAYADETGFRAGTCTPFFWFDLESNTQTNLKVHPFCAMDVSMRNYMELSTEEAKKELNRLKLEIQKVKGEMLVLFHNSNLNDDWNGWDKVLESLF